MISNHLYILSLSSLPLLTSQHEHAKSMILAGSKTVSNKLFRKSDQEQNPHTFFISSKTGRILLENGMDEEISIVFHEHSCIKNL